ncbi:MAG TPA: cyclic nucleotide-binding domain-containing protein [Desulfomicrobiaceae bacterium]|nr:cyclic nucleotide-binding domain-containing protein [Desulfomicrobiaceae bacterium]
MNSSTEPSAEPCEYRENLDMIRNIPYFARMDMEVIKVLAFVCKRKTFRPEEFLFHQGEHGNESFYVISGTGVVIRSDNGSKRIIGEIGSGRSLGTLALIMRSKRLFSLQALTPLTCLVLERKKFQAQLATNPRMAQVFLEAIATRVVEWEDRYLREDECKAQRTLDEVGVSLI